MAENAEELVKAIALLEQERALSNAGADHGKLDNKIADLSQRVSGRAAATAEAPGPSWIDEILEIPGADMPRPVTVAIVGGPLLARTFPADRVSVLGSPAATPPPSGEDSLAAYVTMLARAVNLVAPKTHFVVQPSVGPVTSVASLIAGVQAMTSAKADVLLVAYRSDEASRPVLAQLFKDAASRGMTIVVSAGNEGKDKTPAFLELADQIVIAGAVDHGGRRSPFSQGNERCLWFPGQGIPVSLEGPGGTTDGTGPAAAIAAGFVARYLAVRPGTAPADIIRRIRETAVRRIADGPLVPNLSRALAAN